MFEYYDSINKIPECRYKVMESILNNFSIELHGIDWFEERRETFEGIGHDNWVNMITNNPNYHIILYLDNNELVGFICYEYMENKKVMISEVQIIREYRYKRLVKTLLNEMINNIDKNKCDTFLAGINSNNEHSVNTFTHVGMVKKDRYYEISCNDLYNYLKGDNYGSRIR